MQNQYNFTYCPFNLQISKDQVSTILNEIKNVSSAFWSFNPFRNCDILYIFEKENESQSFAYTDLMQSCPELKNLIQSQIIHWMQPKGRITILRTPGHQQMKVHIDCSPSEVGTLQHKFRLVLTGQVNKLYFLDADLKHHHVPDDETCYILDGGHPHCLELDESEKLTLCIGSPWRGEDLSADYVKNLKLDKALYLSRPPIQESWVAQHLRQK